MGGDVLFNQELVQCRVSQSAGLVKDLSLSNLLATDPWKTVPRKFNCKLSLALKQMPLARVPWVDSRCSGYSIVNQREFRKHCVWRFTSRLVHSLIEAVEAGTRQNNKLELLAVAYFLVELINKWNTSSALTHLGTSGSTRLRKALLELLMLFCV